MDTLRTQLKIGLFGIGLEAYWSQFPALKDRLIGYLGARNFMNEWNGRGPAHHCAVGVGHIATKLKKLGALLGVKCIQVC